jgi:uncharacterized protein YxjI
MDPRVSQNRYTIRRKFLKVFGGAFHIYDPDGNVAFYADMKAFKLKEDFRLYTGEDKQTEVLAIKARQIIDIGATYDVFDPTKDAKAGALRRKGLKSILRDEWLILDPDDREIGVIREDSALLASIRRFLTNLVPQDFIGEVNGQQVLRFNQHFNPFILKMDLDFSMDTGGLLDRRLGLAAALLLAGIEGRQN